MCKEESMGINSMDDLFIHALQDVYYAENQIAKALPEIMEKVTEPALFDHLEHNLGEPREHIKRLEQTFQALGQTPQGVTCQAILGLIEEGEELVREIWNEKVREAAILARNSRTTTATWRNSAWRSPPPRGTLRRVGWNLRASGGDWQKRRRRMPANSRNPLAGGQPTKTIGPCPSGRESRFTISCESMGCGHRAE